MTDTANEVERAWTVCVRDPGAAKLHTYQVCVGRRTAVEVYCRRLWTHDGYGHQIRHAWIVGVA